MRWTNTAGSPDPTKPGDVVTVITSGLVADDISRGDSLESQIQKLTYNTLGTPVVGAAAAQVNLESSLAVSSYRLTGGSTDAIVCPNTKYGDYDGVQSFAVGALVRFTSAASTNAVNKRQSAPNLGYGLGSDGSGRGQLRYETTGGAATLITPAALNDDAWHWLLALFDVSTSEVSISTELMSTVAALIAGSAVNTAPFTIGDGLFLQALGGDILDVVTFRGPQLDGVAPMQLCKQLLFGRDPQFDAGYGPGGELTVDRIA